MDKRLGIHIEAASLKNFLGVDEFAALHHNLCMAEIADIPGGISLD